MIVLTLFCRAVLAAAFAVAGIGKLADRPGTTRTLGEFGVPAGLARLIGSALPMAELACALALVPARTSRAAAVAALLMLTAFSVASAAAIARGKRVECRCFGQFSTGPVGVRTLIRNAVLAALAIGALFGGWGSPAPAFGAFLADLHGTELLAWVFGIGFATAIAIAAWGFTHLLRGYGRLLLRVDALERRLDPGAAASDSLNETIGLPPGSPVPALTATDIAGRSLPLTDVLNGPEPVLLLLTNSGCAPCRELLPTIRRWQDDEGARVRVVIASGGAADDARADAREFGLADVFVDTDLRLFNGFGATATPSAVYIRPDGTIGSFLAAGPGAIAGLRARIAAGGTGTPVAVGLTPGMAVPSLQRRVLDKGTSALADLIQAETLVIFWNPGCGFCRSMRETLRHIERRPSRSARRMIIVSQGEEASVRAEGFASPVLLDPDFSLGRAFGVGGTPMAVLVDAQARVASAVAAGSEAVLALADADRMDDARSG